MPNIDSPTKAELEKTRIRIRAAAELLYEGHYLRDAVEAEKSLQQIHDLVAHAEQGRPEQEAARVILDEAYSIMVRSRGFCDSDRCTVCADLETVVPVYDPSGGEPYRLVDARCSRHLRAS